MRQIFNMTRGFKNAMFLAGALAISLTFPPTTPVWATGLPIITTVAGNGVPGYSGDNGPAVGSQLQYPESVAYGGESAVFIADTSNNRIRAISASDGISKPGISAVAGNGTPGYSGDNGGDTNAELYLPYGVAIDRADNLFIADSKNNRIRKVTSNGYITTVAGNGIAGYSGDNGTATSAELYFPTGVAVDSMGNLFIADISNHCIRKVDAVTGKISTVAGNGIAGYSGDNGAAASAELGSPFGVAVDGVGNLFIADDSNHCIRKVDAITGKISTVAGTGIAGYSGDTGLAINAQLNNPNGVAVDGAGNLFIADTRNNRIRRVDAASGKISTVAGNGTLGYSGDIGIATNAELNFPSGVAVDGAGNLYIADTGNSCIRQVGSYPAPIVSSILPTQGPIIGSTPITINGNNFLSGAKVTIGGNPAANVTWVNEIKLIATTPAGTAGAQDVVVTNTDTQFAKLTGGFTYITPPTIISQTGNITVMSGLESAQISLQITGDMPITYQWYKNGSSISGATGASYNITLPTLADNGSSFTCVVSNAAGSVTSKAIILTVIPAVPPIITQQPQNQTVNPGQEALFSLNISGAMLSYQWELSSNGGSTWGPFGLQTSIADNASIRLNFGQYATIPSNGNMFRCRVFNLAGTVTSNAVTLIVNGVAPIILTQPANKTSTPSQEISFSVVAQGVNPLSYQWQRSNDGGSTWANVNGSSPTYTIWSTASTDNAAQFRCIVTDVNNLTVTSNAAMLTVNASPTIVTQPQNQTVNSGQAVFFFVTAQGSDPLSYQWQKFVNSAWSNIAAATVSTYTFTAAQGDNGSQFRCVVTDVNSLTTTSNAVTLMVTAAVIAPTVTQNPTNQGVTVGQGYGFSATATGSIPMTYRWESSQDNGQTWTILAQGQGGTSGSLTTGISLPTTTLLDNGKLIHCVFGNGAGTVTTNAALLTVTTPVIAPTITQQPVSQTVTEGQTTLFSVVASGMNLTYQWMKNSSPINGATSASYTTPVTTLADNGAQFLCVVSNSSGSVTSNAALLTVGVVSTLYISGEPTDQTVAIGQQVGIGIGVGGSFPIQVTLQRSNDGGGTWSTVQQTNTLSDPAFPNVTFFPIANAAASDNGAKFRFQVANSARSLYSNVITLTVATVVTAPVITQQPSNQSVLVGQSATFSVTATGTSPIYLWRKNNVTILGATSASYSTPPTSIGDNGAQYTCDISNSSGDVTSKAATLTVTTPLPPSVSLASPVNNTAFVAGSNISIAATVTSPNVGGSISKVDFYQGTTLLGTSNSSPYSFNWLNVPAGNYSLTVKATDNNSLVTTSSIVSITVNSVINAPVISGQPTNQGVTVGQSAGFSATATGSIPMTYRWESSQDNGQTWTTIAQGQGGTAGSLTTGISLPNTTLFDNGKLIHCVFGNSVGAATTNAATLTVTVAVVAPTITQQPSNQSVTAGQTATFTVQVSCLSPTYQWNKNNVAISGATSAAYTTPPTTLSDSGATFTCTVRNSAGSVTSNPATLTVTPSTTVTFTSPADHALVSGVVEVTLDASDNIQTIVLYAGSTLVGSSRTPFRFSLNTTGFSNGPIALKASCYDASGVYTEITLQVTVNNAAGSPVTDAPVDHSVTVGNPRLGQNISLQVNTSNSSPHIEAKIADIGNNLVRSLSADLASGSVLSWDGRNDSHEIVAPGVYFVQLTIDGQIQKPRAVAIRGGSASLLKTGSGY